MRIISSYKDFYDAYLQDREEPVWEREERQVAVFNPNAGALPVMLEPYREAVRALHEMPTFQYKDPNYHPYAMHRNTISSYVLVVCGVIVGFYDGGFTDWKQLLEKYPNGESKAFGPYKPKRVERSSYQHKHKPFAEYSHYGSQGWDMWASMYQGKNVGPSSHIVADAPTYLVKSSGTWTEVTANPQIKILGLTKYLPAPELSQRIDLYMNNELVKEKNPIPERTQTLIRDAHGFDNQSFKNTKPDRRKRKQ
jgi:hypothetical protein